MKNLELSQIFYQIADFIEMKDEKDFFRSRAYAKAARVLEYLEKDVEEIYNQGGLKALEEIQGIGEAIATKIEEFIKTGNIKTYNRLKKECPVDLESLTLIKGLGSKKIKVLYRKLKIRSINDLEKAAKAGKISKLDGFGEKSQNNILQAIKLVKVGHGRFLIGHILPIARQITKELEKLPEVGKISIAGSIRRMKETSGDIDILITSLKPKPVMDFFIQMPDVVKVWTHGETKSSVRLKGGFDCDLRVIKNRSFGAALQYFTGSKDHNILIRRIAMKKGLKLNEYGVFSQPRADHPLAGVKVATSASGVRHVSGLKSKKIIAGKTEKDVYNAIGLSYIEPELRTNTGELEAALDNNLPKIIGYNDIKGDCHCHTDWSEGTQTIEQMALSAKKMGYKYIVVTDHTNDLKIANGLDEQSLLRQMQEIDRINQGLKGFKILKGCEVNIRLDGTIDIKDEILSKLDIVLAGVHLRHKMPKQEMTQRIIRAMENPNVDIISHLTGRRIFNREPYELEMDEIFRISKRTKTALEINSQPERLDLKDTDIRKAVKAGVKMVISSDAHSKNDLGFMELGIAQARRGWAEKSDILNTKSLERFLKSF
ncbi:MAG: PHP domain-containing protein [bacterium]